MAGALQMTVKTEGIEACLQVLRDTMPRTAGAAVVAGAMKKAAQPMVARIRALYRAETNGSGSLAAATYAWRARKIKSRGVVRIGPKRFVAAALSRYAREYGSVPTAGLRHGHLVEYGTKSRRQAKTGRATGAMPAAHVIERAANGTLSQVEARFQAILKADMERAIRRRSNRK